MFCHSDVFQMGAFTFATAMMSSNRTEATLNTYRSWLDDSGVPMGVQQKLMRHAQISTTMTVYGNALMEAKREANAAVVRKVLRRA